MDNVFVLKCILLVALGVLDVILVKSIIKGAPFAPSTPLIVARMVSLRQIVNAVKVYLYLKQDSPHSLTATDTA